MKKILALLLTILVSFILLEGKSFADTDTFTVTGLVPPDASDFQFQLTSVGNITSTKQNTQLDYKITYGNRTAGSLPITIRASWSLGTISGQSSPSVNIVNYVSGSASQAYGGTPASVDTNNRTITWTITSVPGNTTDQEVTFSVVTTDSYRESNSITFEISSYLVSSGVTLPTQTVSQTYLYESSRGSERPLFREFKPQTGDATEKQSFVDEKLSILSVTVSEISHNSALIEILTSRSSLVTLYYGNSPYNLDNSVNKPSETSLHRLNLVNLSPETKYYFQIVASSQDTEVTSSIHEFQTARVSDAPGLERSSTVISINDLVFKDWTTGEAPIVIPQGATINIKVKPRNVARIGEVWAVIRKELRSEDISEIASVKGTSEQQFRLSETHVGIYQGQAQSYLDKGSYELLVKLSDYDGNRVEETLGRIKIVSSMQILQLEDSSPVESAFIYISHFNTNLNLYEPISQKGWGIPQPLRSSLSGTVSLVLPPGKYEANILAAGYKSQTVIFNIDASENPYPVIMLEKDTTYSAMISYYRTLAKEWSESTLAGISSLSESSRFFDLIILVVSATLVLGLIAYASLKTGVTLFKLPIYLIRVLEHQITDNPSSISGVILDSDRKPLHNAHIYLVDSKKNKILSKTLTDITGRFFLPVKKTAPEKIKIAVMKEGYDPSYFMEYETKTLLNSGVVLVLREENPEKLRAFNLISFLYRSLAQGIYISIMSFGAILSLLFLTSLGVLRSSPLLLLISLNVLLWILLTLNSRNSRKLMSSL